MTDVTPLAVIDGVSRRVVEDPETHSRREYYVGFIPSDWVKMLTFVPVYEESAKSYLVETTDDGYQRPGSAARMRAFGKFLGDNPLFVVPPVILSGRGYWQFEGDEFGSLRVEGAAAVIDGQHRIGGYVYLHEQDQRSRPIDFYLIPARELDAEIHEFTTINNTQKGVPKSLTVILEGSDEAVITIELDERDDSLFKGRITRAQRRRGHLFSAAAVAKNVARTFHHGAFQGVDIDRKIDIMIRYWTIIADTFPDEWGDIDRQDPEFKLLETTGLIAWSLAGDDILGPAFDPETNTMNWDRVEAAVAKLAVQDCVDWRKDGEFQGLTGEVGGARIRLKMQQCLSMGASSPSLEETEGRQEEA